MGRLQDAFLFRREPLLDLAAHLLGHSLDFPRFHREPCIAAQIFGGLLELRLATRSRHESAHAGRIGGLDDIQKLVVRETSLGLLYCFGGGDNTVAFQGKVFAFVQIYQP